MYPKNVPAPRIIQLIAPSRQSWAAFENVESPYGIFIHLPVEFFALCENGEVRSLSCREGNLSINEDVETFCGVFTDEQRQNYPLEWEEVGSCE